MTVTEPQLHPSEAAPDTPGPAAPAADGLLPAVCSRCSAALAEDQEWCVECGSRRTVIRPARGWRAPLFLVGSVFTAALLALAIALVALSSDANRVADTKIASTTPTVTVTTPATAPTTPAAAAVVPPVSAAPASPPAAATPVTPAATPAPTTSASPASPAGSASTTPTATGSTTPQKPPATATTGPRSTTASDPARRVTFDTWPPGLGGWTVVLYAAPSRTSALARAHQLAGRLSGIGVLISDDHPLLAPGFYVVFDDHYATRAQAQTAARKLQAQGFTSAHARQVEPPGGN